MHLQATKRSAPEHGPGWSRGQTLTLDVPSPEEVAKIAAHFNRGSTGIRNRALLAVLYRAGLRISEAVGAPPRPARSETRMKKGERVPVERAACPAKPGLRLSDYDPAARTLRIRAENAKGGRPRVARIDAQGASELSLWIERRARLGIPKTAPLFCQLDGSPWTRQAAAEAVRHAAVNAGFEVKRDDGRRFNLHSFRHAHAVTLIRAGMRPDLIMQQLGHANLAITTAYIRSISSEEVGEALDAAFAKVTASPAPPTLLGLEDLEALEPALAVA
ncbi:MAG: integrase/recombinase XerD [Miltoncostaeaceae bacterium]|jgi:integrase/recombinase XerD|nr:integrase/recombinase XerD [Miltoncostaeaceae bacterium]